MRKVKRTPQIEVLQGLERLYLKDYSNTLFVVAKNGTNIRQICTLEEYEKGFVEVRSEDGKRVLITLQSVSR